MMLSAFRPRIANALKRAPNECLVERMNAIECARAVDGGCAVARGSFARGSFINRASDVPVGRSIHRGSIGIAKRHDSRRIRATGIDARRVSGKWNDARRIRLGAA
jgi:hypothetical protein